ncbi:BrnT family toxin [candidate division KSB1 bacterium]|nr:BrnT family toxin [candidate division KSB1 bacterium]
MDIIWDQNKNEWLILNRGISFDEIADRILGGDYLEILENPTRDEQLYFIMKIKNYIWVVPFILNEHDQIVLKTAFPSRKFHTKYGDNNENK